MPAYQDDSMRGQALTFAGNRALLMPKCPDRSVGTLASFIVGKLPIAQRVAGTECRRGLYLADNSPLGSMTPSPSLGLARTGTSVIRSLGGRLLTRFPAADGVFRRLIWSRFEFPEAEMKFIDSLPSNSIDVAVDVGAARGAYSWILSRKSRQVFAFEPGEQHGRYLESAIGRSNIRLVRAAVGSTSGNAQMYTPGSSEQAPYLATLNPSNPVTGRSDVQVRMVDQVTLDSFFADKLEGRSIDFVKVDVEGYELEVFLGAGRLIARHHPLIICEIEQRHNRDCDKVFQLLRSAGYKTYIFQDKRFQPFDGDSIEHLQTSPPRGSHAFRYINNFVFQHTRSRIKVVEGAN